MPCSAFSSSNSIWRMVVLSVSVYQPQPSSASRFTAGASGFLNLSQSGVRPER